MMRTNVAIDDRLMERAIAAGKFPTKRAAIEEGLRLLVRLEAQRQLRALKGQVQWEGDLDEMRLD
jgi:Arc/MetJ family transcription regulator